jgi:hypothetical protein
MKLNDHVQTPYGLGTVNGNTEDGRVIVRLPVNDITSPHLPESFGTPHAVGSGLWDFSPDEVTVVDHVSTDGGALHKKRRARYQPSEHPPVVQDVVVEKHTAVKAMAPPPAGEGFSKMLRRLHAEGKPEDDIYEAAVLHVKFAGDAKKARAYASSFLRKLRQEKN